MLVGIKDIQKKLHVSRKTVFDLMDQGMPKVRISERILRFDPDEVMDWIKKKVG
jgi:predicted DNA-binding transcriptional regulator AlpA